MGLNMIESIREMRVKYGDVFRIMRFGCYFIYVNGMENLREIFIKRVDVFFDCLSNYYMEYILKGYGIYCLKFCLKNFFFIIKNLNKI